MRVAARFEQASFPANRCIERRRNGTPIPTKRSFYLGIFAKKLMKRLISAVVLCLPPLAWAGELSLSCIGEESANCPVVVDVTLRQERLTAEFQVATAAGGTSTTTLNFCGYPGSAANVYYGEWVAHQKCVVGGKFRVLNGELTKQQLADGVMRFEIHTGMAYCDNSIGSARCSLVTR